jgi:hypothetical protein
MCSVLVVGEGEPLGIEKGEGREKRGEGREV